MSSKKRKRKTGRIRCGTCPQGPVLHDLGLRRRPRAHEVREYRRACESGNATLATLDHVEQHHHLRPLGQTGTHHVDNHGTNWLLLQCKCGTLYALAFDELRPRVKAARQRGEDVILTAVDRARHAGRSR